MITITTSVLHVSVSSSNRLCMMILGTEERQYLTMMSNELDFLWEIGLYVG